MQIVYHLVSMVRTDRNGNFPPLFNLQQRFHHAVHIDIPAQVVSLIEIAFAVPLRASQMDEIHTFAKFIHHADQIVIGPHAQRPRTQTQTIGTVWNGLDKFAEIIRRRHDTGQAQYGIRGSSG